MWENTERWCESRVGQTFGRQSFRHRHIARPTVGARCAEAHVVEQHDNNVGSALWRAERMNNWRTCIARIECWRRFHRRLRNRQHSAAVDRSLRPRSGDCPERCKKRAPRGRQQQFASVHFEALSIIRGRISRPKRQVCDRFPWWSNAEKACLVSAVQSDAIGQSCRCWSGRACPLCPGISDVNLFRYARKTCIDLDAEVSDGAFDFGVAKHSSEPLQSVIAIFFLETDAD